jgi:hypothetical protein
MGCGKLGRRFKQLWPVIGGWRRVLGEQYSPAERYGWLMSFTRKAFTTLTRGLSTCRYHRHPGFRHDPAIRDTVVKAW